MTKEIKGYLMILLSALGFGSYGTWTRLIGPDFGAFNQGWIRSAIVLIVLIPIAYYTKAFKPVDKKDRKWILVTMGFGILTQAPLYYAFNHLSIGTATLIFYASYVIASYGIGSLALSERIGIVKIVALVIALIGLGITFGLSLAIFSFLALSLAAVNGIASGGEVSMTKKISHKYSSLQVGIYIWFTIFITHFPLSFIVDERLQVPSFSLVWLAIIGYAVVGLISFWLVIEGYKYVDASIGGLIGLFEIIFGILFGIILFHEHLTTSIVIGGSLIIIAAMLPDLVNIGNKYKSKKPRAVTLDREI